MKLRSILIVDDNEVDVYILKRLIKKAELCDVVFEANNGQTALDFMENYAENTEKHPATFPPLLILVDINMPLVNGFEFLEKFSEIRNKHNYDSCVLMMFSSSENIKDKERALTYDFVSGFITKMPSSADDLKAEIKKCFHC